MATKENITPAHPMPFANEAEPALDRRSGLLEQQRQSSGGLSDDPADNPVRDDLPFKVTHSDSRDGRS